MRKDEETRRVLTPSRSTAAIRCVFLTFLNNKYKQVTNELCSERPQDVSIAKMSLSGEDYSLGLSPGPKTGRLVGRAVQRELSMIWRDWHLRHSHYRQIQKSSCLFLILNKILFSLKASKKRRCTDELGHSTRSNFRILKY